MGKRLVHIEKRSVHRKKGQCIGKRLVHVEKRLVHTGKGQYTQKKSRDINTVRSRPGLCSEC